MVYWGRHVPPPSSRSSSSSAGGPWPKAANFVPSWVGSDVRTFPRPVARPVSLPAGVGSPTTDVPRTRAPMPSPSSRCDRSKTGADVSGAAAVCARLPAGPSRPPPYAPPRASSRSAPASHACAKRRSRMAVGAEMPNASPISSSVSPAK